MKPWRPNWHRTQKRWTGLSPYDNPHVVRWDRAPAWRRFLWLLDNRLAVKR